MGSFGLRTYIWNNRIKSFILLLGFPFLLLLICYAFALVIAAFSNPNVGDGIANATRIFPSLIPVALISSLIWFTIAWFANAGIIAAVTGAHTVTRQAEPRLWNLLENLCISRGLTMPTLRIIETPARNAFASGVRKRQYSITVTRGLMDTLNDAELEAVLGHELTHIENRDVQLLVIAAVFVGVISLVGDLIVRTPRALFYSMSGSGSGSGGSYGGESTGSGWSSGSGGGGRSGGRSEGKGGGGGAIILILIAVAIFLVARLLAIALRLAMSRKREYLADAGSVELTKNPDAMISALRKIEGHSAISAPRQVQEMFLDHDEDAGFVGKLFMTHPTIDNRIAALEKYAGGHDIGPQTPAVEAATAASPTIEAQPGTAAAPDIAPDVGEAPGAGPWGPSSTQGPWGTSR